MFRSRFRKFLAVVLTVCSVWLTTPAQAQSPDKLKLSYVAPEECLLFFTWNGCTKSDPKTTNRTEQLFAEESVQDFGKQLLEEITKQLSAAAADHGDEGIKLAAEVGPVLAKILLSHPGAIYVKSFKAADDPEIEMAIVVDAEQEGPAAIAALKKLLTLTPQEGPQIPIEEKIGDTTFLRPKEYRQHEPEFRFGYRTTQLLITLGKATPKELVAKLQKPGKPAAWVTKVAQDLAVEKPSMLMFLDAHKLIGILSTLPEFTSDPNAAKVLEALGINKLKTFTAVSGLDKTGMHSVSMITTDGTPTGLFDLMPDKPISLSDFKNIPANASSATVARFDLAYLYGKVMKGLADFDLAAHAQIEQAIESVEPQLGFSIKGDVLEGLGDTWSFYTSASEAGVSFVPGFVITASIRKHEGVAKGLNTVVMAAKAALGNAGPQAPFSIQDFKARGEIGYRIVFNNLPIPVQPTWVLTKDQLVIGLSPQLVSSHLAGTAKGSMADNAQLKAAFQWNPKPLVVSYSDPKPGLQSVYTLVNSFSPMLIQQMAQEGINFNLPPLPPFGDIEQHLLPNVTTFGRTSNGWKTESHGVIPSGVEIGPAGIAVGAALLLPAVQQAREAARRAQAKNNLKMIGLAMHNYHDTHRAFPPAANVDKKDKKLLSWRVHILPFVDQIALYQQFHLDEPWDSEHNKQFIKQIPPVYVQPTHADLAKEGKTVYLVPTGEGTAFDGNEGRPMVKFTDGTSNTILAVEAHRDAAVIWTKPDDLAVDLKNPLKNLKSALTGGFHVLLADGSVRFVSDNINANTLKLLFTISDGQAVNFDAIDAPVRRRVVARPGDPKNNLKQVALAMHNYADTFGHFPQRAVTDKEGKALLSWRVHLLPFLEANDLYQQFHLDEPWDSDHNKTLIDQMPVTFTAVGDQALAKQGKTRYVTPANAEACLGVKEGTKFRDIRDGTSNTIMAVEVHADAAVIWTKPDDILIDFKDPLKSLKDARNGSFLAMMCDGSVRLISGKINVETFKALITRDGKEAVGDF
ncbi:MAG: DUF1559 domain-containing protein [Planctomycetaceae bacterium]